jgi:hypothetical protein
MLLLHEVYDSIIITQSLSDFFFTEGRAICIPEGKGIFYWLLTSDSSFSEEQAVESVAVLSPT